MRRKETRFFLFSKTTVARSRLLQASRSGEDDPACPQSAGGPQPSARGQTRGCSRVGLGRRGQNGGRCQRSRGSHARARKAAGRQGVSHPPPRGQRRTREEGPVEPLRALLGRPQPGAPERPKRVTVTPPPSRGFPFVQAKPQPARSSPAQNCAES